MIGMRAENPLDLETMVPRALERNAPVIIGRAVRGVADTSGPAGVVCLQSTVGATAGGPDHLLSPECLAVGIRVAISPGVPTLS